MKKEQDPVLDPVWEELVSRYDDASRHDAFVELARTMGRLADAVARYRRRLGSHPEDETARARIEQIANLLIDQMSMDRPESMEGQGGRSALRSLVLVFVFLLLLSGLLWMVATSIRSAARNKGANTHSGGPGTEPVNLKNKNP